VVPSLRLPAAWRAQSSAIQRKSASSMTSGGATRSPVRVSLQNAARQQSCSQTGRRSIELDSTRSPRPRTPMTRWLTWDAASRAAPRRADRSISPGARAMPRVTAHLSDTWQVRRVAGDEYLHHRESPTTAETG
jgi:hypothetical protein